MIYRYSDGLRASMAIAPYRIVIIALAMTVPTLAFMPFRVLRARKVIVWLREVHRERGKQSICFVNKPLYRGCKYSHVRL